MLKVEYLTDYLQKEEFKSQQYVEQNSKTLLRRAKRAGDDLKLPEGFKVEEAIGGGDCFFDSVAKGLKQLKPNMEFSVKSLRQICKKLAIGNQQLKAKVIKDVRNSHDLTIVLPDSSIGDDELWNTYLASIEYTSEDIERMKVDNPSSYQSLTSLKCGNTLQVPIWGRPDIEGQLICNEYNVKLHIIENLLNAGWSNQIIDESSSRSIDNVDYNEANTIHIINRGTNHFEPILDTMKTVHQENQLTHDDSQSRSEQQQLESRAKRVISNFNRPRSSSQVGMLDSRQQSATDTDFDKVNRRLEEFVGYFVKEFEAKLHAYHMILEGEVKKSGKFSDTFSGKIGQGVGAAAGGLVGLLLGSPVSGAKLGAKAGEEGGKKLGSKIGDKQHKKKITNLLGLVDLSQKDKANFRRELVEAGFDVFQSFEMQFMRVTTDQGTKKAIQQLAKDATNRAINYVEKKDASITEGVIFGKSKREGVSSISPGFEIKYEYLSNKKIWSTTNLYDKVGVLVTQKNKPFYHKKKSGSDTGKYGYRRLLISENWEKLKEDYEPDNIVESKSIQFTDYIYILDQKDLKQKVEGILREINLDDKDLEEERMKKILEEVKDDIMNEVNALKRQSHQYTEDRKILVNIEANLKNLKIDEYLRKFKQDFEEVKQGQQKIVKSIEIGQEENRENFNQLSQKQDIHHDNNKREHKKTQEGVVEVVEVVKDNNKKINEIHEVVVTQKSKQTKETIWFDMKEPVTLFTGRKEELSDLHGKIQRSSEKVTVISQMTSISGLGGIGKTELSRQYIQENSKDYDNNLIWINAESEATLIESFSRLAKNKLRIATKNIDGEEKDIKSIVEEVYKFFSKRKSLFIFDNAENNEYLNRFLPLRSLAPDVNKPYILITSRNREWEKGIEVMDLNELKLQDAIEFVKNGLDIKDESQDQEIKTLVEKLQSFPLAIQQVIAYIEDQRVIGEFSIDDYLEEYKKKTEDLLDSEVFRGINNDYAKTTFTTWKITIDKIASDREHGELALKVLNAIAYFAPENINREIFLELAVGDERKLRSAVRLLVKYSMVNGERKQSVLSIHRLVQEVTRLELKGQGKEEENLKEVLKLVEANLKKENLDHSVSAWNHASKHDKLVKEFSKLPIQIISELNGAGRYKEVYLFGEEVLKLFVQLELKQQDILSIRHSIAEVLFKQSKFKEALEAYKNVFNERKKELGEDHFDTLKTWYGMAWTLDRLGRTEEALEEFQKILEKICLEPECSRDRSLFIFKIRDRIAWLLINQYKLKEALEVSKQVLEKKEKLLGLDDPDTLYTKGIVATILSRQNKTEEALRIYEEIFAKYKEALGEDHPTTLNTQHHILIELRTLNEGNSIKLNDVLKSFQELFEKRKRVLEENHSDTLDSYQELAFTLLMLDKPQEALDIYKEIFEKRKEAIGSDQATIRIKHQMAMALNDVGCYQEALTMYKEVFKKRKEILGIDHGMTFNTQKNMLIMSLERNDLDIVNFLASEEADFNVHYENGRTPLMWMIKEKKVDAMKILLQYGADVLARNDHDTVLHQAVSSSNEEVIRLVLNKIKEKDPQNFSEHINAKDTEGDTPLMWAAENGKTNAAKILLEYGADLNAQNNDGETALHRATKGGYQELVQLLLDNKADPNIQNNNGKAPLDLAKEKLTQDPGDESHQREEQRSVSLEECLPSTSSGRRKREAKIGECEFSWEDVDKFNEEKDEIRDLSRIKIDSEKFIRYLENIPEGKRFQLIQLADEVQVTGKSQSLVNKLIGNQKIMSHLNRVGRISGMTMHGMMAKNVLADFLNGDYQGVAVNVGFMAGGQGFAKVAEAASFKGLKLASEGKLLLGRSLRAASPFLARGTSAFVIYDLVNQIKAFKNGTEEALVGVVGDSIYLGIDAAEIGIEIAEAFEVLEGVSSVTGPIGATIGAVVFVGTDVYMAVKRVDKIDEIIRLTGKEKFVEGLRAFIGMQPEQYIEELMEEKQLYNQLAKQGFEYLRQHNDIQRYVFSTGKSVIDSCRTVPYQTSICSNGFNWCSARRTVTRYTEKCTTKFEEDLDNTVLLDKRRADIKWSRAKPDNPNGGYAFCLPQGNYEPVPSYGSYLCKSAIGITDLATSKTGGYTLFNLGKGTDYAKGFIGSPNIFVVNDGSKEYYGGKKDDIFILQGNAITGYFHGEGGVNTLDLTSFAPEEGSIEVKLDIGQVEDYYRKNFFGMSGINKFLGRKDKADQVFITCDSSTSDIKFVDGQSGSEEGFADHINIHDKDCAYEMQVVVRPNTVIYNRALKGDFNYIVPYALGSAKIDFLYSNEALNLNNTFTFKYEPTEIKNIDVKNVNTLNKTSHIITFNFLPMSDKEFNITVSGAENPVYRLGNNTEIKVGNKGNLYMLENTNQSVDEIIKDYLVVANRLNRMSFFIQSLLSNETVAIGSGNYEVIHNNPLQKSHLVGNGGENVYVIDSECKALAVNKLPLPEVTIYDFDAESSVDTIDLRSLVQQAKSKFSNSFELQVLKSANDLLLKATVTEVKPTEDLSINKIIKHEYFTVRLKDGINWYNKTHVIMDNVPMRINLDNNEWSLKPLPLVFEKDKEVIIVTSQDIEENTELITPKRAGNYSFVRDNGSDLMITNAFDANVTRDDLCTIVLSKFYETPKMETLSIKFADKEVVLKEQEGEISKAKYLSSIKKEKQDKVYKEVFGSKNMTPEVVMLSDQPVTHRHRHEHHIRNRRSEYTISSGTRPSSWINDLFSWVKSSVGGLLDSKPNTANSISQVNAPIDVNGTIMLLDVLIRKITGQKYMSSVDQPVSLLEAQGHAFNITKEFKKVVEQAGLKSGVSMHRLNIDYIGMQKEITRKVMSGKFNEISGILKLYVEKACPDEEAGKLSPKKFDKFIAQFNKGLLNQSIEQILHNRDGRLEVDDAKQMSLEPQSYLSNASVHSHSKVSTFLSEIGVTKLRGNLNR